MFETCCEGFHEALLEELDYALELPHGRRMKYLRPLRRLFEDYGIPFRMVFSDGCGAVRVDAGLEVRPIPLEVANALVAARHEHSKPVKVARFSLGLFNGADLVGCAVVGNPVARMIATRERRTLEVLRVCTDRELPAELTAGGCSMLYLACEEPARSLGATKLITYVLESETGRTAELVGYRRERKTRPESWHREGRARASEVPAGAKWRLGKYLDAASAPLELILAA